MSSTPQGSGELSQSDAINMLLDTTSPTEVVSEDQEAPIETSSEEVIETETEEVKADTAEESQVEAEADEVSETEEQGDEPYYTVKVDGQEYEVNEAELIKSYQLEKTAQKRLSDAAEQRKLIEADRTAIEQ